MLRDYKSGEHPINPQLAKQRLQKFFEAGSSQNFGRRKIIHTPTTSPSNAYWIEGGYVKAVTYDNKGDERLHYIYGPGEIFPLAGLFSDSVEVPTFQAVGEVTLRTRSAVDFSDFISHHPTVLIAIIDQMVPFIDRIYCLNMTPSDQRVKYALLLLTERFGVPEEGHMLIRLALTQQEFGDMLRMTRESAGLKLRELEDCKVLLVGRDQLRVYPEQLREMLDD